MLQRPDRFGKRPGEPIAIPKRLHQEWPRVEDIGHRPSERTKVARKRDEFREIAIVREGTRERVAAQLESGQLGQKVQCLWGSS